MKKIKELYKINKKIILCISIITIIGIISGSIFYLILSKGDKATVNDSIVNFFNSIKNNSIDYSTSLKSGLVSNTIFVIFIWAVGISIIGVPLILLLYFFKTFSIGFTLISIISNYSIKGTLYAFLYLFPHNVISLLFIAVLSVYALIYSFKTMSSFFKKEVIDFKPIMYNYKYILVITLLVVILCSLYQTFVMPIVLKGILKIIN